MGAGEEGVPTDHGHQRHQEDGEPAQLPPQVCSVKRSTDYTVLSSVPLLAELPSNILLRISDALEPEQFQAGEVGLVTCKCDPGLLSFHL